MRSRWEIFFFSLSIGSKINHMFMLVSIYWDRKGSYVSYLHSHMFLNLLEIQMEKKIILLEVEFFCSRLICYLEVRNFPICIFCWGKKESFLFLPIFSFAFVFWCRIQMLVYTSVAAKMGTIKESCKCYLFFAR